MIRFPHVLQIPKVQLIFFLSVIFLSSLTVYPQAKYSIGFLLAMFFTATFDVLLTFVRQKIWFIPYAGIVTGMIIGLIMSPDLSWYAIAVIAAIAVASKQFLRLKTGHFFNPAAAGLVLGGILLQEPVTWWGGSFQNLFGGNVFHIVSFLLILSPLALSAFRLKRYLTIVSFLVVHVLLSYIMKGQTVLSAQSLLFAFMDPTVLFFAIVMLPEPRTSPIGQNWQVLYGTSVALIANLLGLAGASQFFLSWRVSPDPLLTALLIGNVLNFLLIGKYFSIER